MMSWFTGTFRVPLENKVGKGKVTGSDFKCGTEN
jgi:hypothetical protein